MADNLHGVGCIIRRPPRSRRRFSGDQRVVLAGGGLFLRERIHPAVRAYKRREPCGSPIRSRRARKTLTHAYTFLRFDLPGERAYIWRVAFTPQRYGGKTTRAGTIAPAAEKLSYLYTVAAKIDDLE